MSLEAFAADCAAPLGYGVRVVVVDRLPGMARVRRRGRTAEITIDERVEQLSRRSQQTVIAHELGHLAHPRSLVWTCVAALALVTFATVLLAVLSPAWSLITWLLIPLLWLILLAALRREEFAADAWAAQTCSLPFDEAHRTQLAHADLLVIPRIGWLSTHPSPASRSEQHRPTPALNHEPGPAPQRGDHR